MSVYFVFLKYSLCILFVFFSSSPPYFKTFQNNIYAMHTYIFNIYMYIYICVYNIYINFVCLIQNLFKDLFIYYIHYINVYNTTYILYIYIRIYIIYTYNIYISKYTYNIYVYIYYICIYIYIYFSVICYDSFFA